MRLLICSVWFFAACADRPIAVPLERESTPADGPLADLGAGDLSLAPVRLLAPLSSSTVTSRRPSLRWQGGGPGVQVELCADRACKKSLAAPITVDVTGTSARVDAPLRPGPVFWRVHAGAQVTPTWQFWAGERDASVDNSYGSRLDVNGDGFSDVAIAETGGESSDDKLIDAGGLHVFLGGASGLSTQSIDLPALESPPAFLSNFNVGSAGDLDGDGFCDLVASSISNAPYPNPAGAAAHVYFGGADGPRADRVTTLTAPDGNYEYGRVAVGAGDVDGDGYGDLLVTAIGGTRADAPSYLYFGGANGPSPARMQLLPSPADMAGIAAASGDFNGDGHGDLVLGSPYEANGDGRAYVYFGGPAGLGLPTTLVPPEANRGFGRSVTTADLDGDGYSDVVVTGFQPAAAWVFKGGPGGLGDVSTRIPWPGAIHKSFTEFGQVATAGDVDHDGRDDLLLGNLYDKRSFLFRGGTGITIAIALPLDEIAIAGAGDVDGDGFDDVIIGLRGSPMMGWLALLFAGGPDGLRSSDYHQARRLEGPLGRQSLFALSVAGLR